MMTGVVNHAAMLLSGPLLGTPCPETQPGDGSAEAAVTWAVTCSVELDCKVLAERRSRAAAASAVVRPDVADAACICAATAAARACEFAVALVT
jgi:hypothetical protein